MPLTDMVVMVAVFGAVVLTIIHLLRLIGLAVMHSTVRRAIDREPATAEPLLAKLAAPQEARERDDRTAVLLIGFGIAMVAASLVIGDPSWLHYGVAGAIFPLLLGTALLLRLYVVRRRQAGRGRQQ